MEVVYDFPTLSECLSHFKISIIRPLLKQKTMSVTKHPKSWQSSSHHDTSWSIKVSIAAPKFAIRVVIQPESSGWPWQCCQKLHVPLPAELIKWSLPVRSLCQRNINPHPFSYAVHPDYFVTRSFEWKEACMSAQLHETQWDDLVNDIYTCMTEAWFGQTWKVHQLSNAKDMTGKCRTTE